MKHTHRSRYLLGGLLVLLLAACANTNTGSGSLHHLTIGLTYVPNIQFAPFYAAAELGYYRDAGLDVTLRHHSFTEDEFGALSNGQEDAIFGAGDEVLQAHDKGLPVTYVAPIYTQYPITLIVPANSSIHTAADLRGHSIGVPGLYGATYIGLLSQLQSAGLTANDVKIQAIGYTQTTALAGNKVDAVMGYLNNEPIQFKQAGFAVRTIPVFSGSGLSFISNGIAALSKELSAHPDDIKHLIAATLRGVAYVNAHPQDALNRSKKYVPDLADPTQSANALAVLQASIPLWQNTGKPMDPAAWKAMAQFMQTHGLLSSKLDVTTCFSNAYLASS